MGSWSTWKIRFTNEVNKIRRGSSGAGFYEIQKLSF
ncbi:unnamed protein product [Onchocerca flexuosa]|uniref:Reverse transcriptase n=1 Tax=Onchocerca flexuosa TaxID=387005 RepID=A0A183I6K7_9BILA|nr:unnamed protein product [Onchocerca flexuosa]